MLRYVASRYDRKNMDRSLDRQSRLTPTPFKPHDLPPFSRIDEGERFFARSGSVDPLSFDGETAVFETDVEGGSRSNRTFDCVVSDSGAKDHAIIVFHHWYSRSRYPAFAKFFASRGITVVQATLPFHFGRRVSDYGEEAFFNADIGGTVQSVRQAVLDGRKVVGWLKSEGYRSVSVVGMCLGGLVAGLVAANDLDVDSAVLMVTPVNPADLVWTGETFKRLRSVIEPHMTLEQLRDAWAIISLEGHLFGLTRPDLRLMFVNGRADTIVRPEPTQRLIGHFESCFLPVELVQLSCGHSSIGMFPYNLIAARRVLRFVKDLPSLRDLWEMRGFGYDFSEATPKEWVRGGR